MSITDNQIGAEIHNLAGGRTRILKTQVVRRDAVAESNAVTAPDDVGQMFTNAGAIEPPYEPHLLANLVEQSSYLRQCIDAIVTNCDGFGHEFVPLIDLDSDEADAHIGNAMYLDRLRAWKADPNHKDPKLVPPAGILWPTPQEVQQRRLELADEMRLEHSALVNFFDYCTSEYSFTDLRQMSRFDSELHGNGYWEVLRDQDISEEHPLGKLSRFVHVPGTTVRLLMPDKDPVLVSEKVRISDLSFDTRPTPRFFRRYVQIFQTYKVFFKEFGDPRPMSAQTGKIIERFDAEGNPVLGKDETLATEMLHYRPIGKGTSGYGVCRWIGTMLEVLGARQASEVNFLFFENKSIPPMAIIVKGGVVTEQTVKELKDFILSEIKGKGNFHDVMILQVDSPDGGGPTDIEFKPLNQAIQQDALFQQYDTRAGQKVRQAFRLAPMMVGDTTDYNRATADAALYQNDTQVFAPERSRFDWAMNRWVLPDLGIKYWKYQSRGPQLQDPVTLAPLILQAVQAGILMPEEGRPTYATILGKPLKKLSTGWGQRPLPISIAMMQNAQNLQPGPGDDDPMGGILNGDGGVGPEDPPNIGEGLSQINPLAAGLQPRVGQEKDGEGTGDGSGTFGTFSTGDLASGGGLRNPSQLITGTSTPPKAPRKRRAGQLLQSARQLLRLRDAYYEAEKEEARDAFLETKLAERLDRSKPKKKKAPK